jgi:hypothetical protein
MQAGEWMRSLSSPATGPTELMTRIRQALGNLGEGDLAQSIAVGLAFSLGEVPQKESHPEQPERLPLARARKEAIVFADRTVQEFGRHVLESWVLAQHSYWSVGRGLGDARARGKMLLRLRIILDEGGWTLTPGAPRGSAPRPTPDRLQTAIMLATECGMFS